MVETEIVETKNGAALGIKVNLPNAPLILVRAEKGYLGCGYFSNETIEKLGDSAAIVRGVKDFKSMLRARVVYVSPKAHGLGVRVGMTGERALEHMI